LSASAAPLRCRARSLGSGATGAAKHATADARAAAADARAAAAKRAPDTRRPTSGAALELDTSAPAAPPRGKAMRRDARLSWSPRRRGGTVSIARVSISSNFFLGGGEAISNFEFQSVFLKRGEVSRACYIVLREESLCEDMLAVLCWAYNCIASREIDFAISGAAPPPLPNDRAGKEKSARAAHASALLCPRGAVLVPIYLRN
jgi:hypothetical protein